MTDRTERRSERRRHTAFRAYVSGRGGDAKRACMVSDAGLAGCRIVCTRLRELPDEIHLFVDTLPHPIDGRVVWRRGREAGIAFIWRTEGNCEAEPRRAAS